MYGDLIEADSKRGFAALKDRFFQSSKSQHDIELRSDFVCPNFGSNAVVVKGAFKSYGSLKVLEDFSMTVPKGTIYALLGASGCGKTTLLNCLNGRKTLNYGDIYVLGKKVPAVTEAKIGYMPQSAALYADLTVEETLCFFGRVMDMEESKIKQRTSELINLLIIPQRRSKVGNLSGGEQRRVSLAVALLHESELLILDEPTVGADSLLRQLIWDYFLNLTKTKGTTIIITTHYIEEALQADLVGLMRGGYLMAENHPLALLRLYESSSLEEVFLKLSMAQNQNSILAKPSMPPAKASKTSESVSLNLNHMKALTLKDLLWFYKNWSVTLIAIILPVLMISIFCLAIGHNPVNFQIAVVNYEVEPDNCNGGSMSCQSDRLSCYFLSYLSCRKINMKFYDTELESVYSVMTGNSYAAITIKPNYSKALRARVDDWFGSNPMDIELSNIDVVRDLSNTHLSIYTQSMLYDVLKEFIQAFLESCEINKDVGNIPIRLDPIYGWRHSNFTNFCLPGALLSIVFTTSLVLTSLAMQTAQDSTVVERLLTMGVNRTELIISRITVDSLVVVFQTVSNMVFTFLVFKMTIKGSVILTAILLFLTGFFGISYGMFVSCLTDSEYGVTLIAVGTSFITVLLSGVVWPLEGAHWLLKPIVPFFPLTIPTESMRNILHRDWSFLKQEVFLGFFTITLWAAICVICTIVIVKLKRY